VVMEERRMKVKLTQIEKAYLLRMRDWRNDNELRSRTREYSLLNMVNQEDWFEKVSRDRNNEMFAIHCEAGFIGVCGLCHIDWLNGTAEVSIYIGDSKQRGKGFGTEVLGLLKEKAFDEFNLHKLYAEIYSNNPASIALFEKSGYTLEGTLRKHVYKCGEYRDSLMYGLLKDD